MKILISGSHGLIGSSLLPRLRKLDHEVLQLHRSLNQKGPFWNPETGQMRFDDCKGIDAVIHLAGESIAGEKWTAHKKEKIFLSRVEGTRLLAQAVAEFDPPPRIFLSASAVGFYGNRGLEFLDESAEPGTGFFADLCKQWEQSANPAKDSGIRVVNLRFGMVLSRYGGALPQYARLIGLFINPKMGDGTQLVSWITISEVVDAILYILANEEISGPVNITTPNPIPNVGLAKSLTEVLGKSVMISIPTFALRRGLGEMADELLLSSQNVVPRKLMEAGFGFRYSHIQEALEYIYRD
jgi:uncharacterized protein (TIGR01777 family)